MKPLSREKFSSLSSPSTMEKPTMKKVSPPPETSHVEWNLNPEDNAGRWFLCLFQSHILDAVLLLLRDLDEEELHVVHTATQNRLQAYTLDSGDSQRVSAQRSSTDEIHSMHSEQWPRSSFHLQHQSQDSKTHASPPGTFGLFICTVSNLISLPMPPTTNTKKRLFASLSCMPSRLAGKQECMFRLLCKIILKNKDIQQ